LGFLLTGKWSVCCNQQGQTGDEVQLLDFRCLLKESGLSPWLSVKDFPENWRGICAKEERELMCSRMTGRFI